MAAFFHFAENIKSLDILPLILHFHAVSYMYVRKWIFRLHLYKNEVQKRTENRGVAQAACRWSLTA
jgi:hypothetical protein